MSYTCVKQKNLRNIRLQQSPLFHLPHAWPFESVAMCSQFPKSQIRPSMDAY